MRILPSLAVKYRPATFSDLTEQSTICEILENITNSDPIPVRNFLFVGPAGCGKTTLGRALAHKLNHNDSNIIEVDAASNNGVDSVRQLISQMQTYPVGSKYKIFILDECFHKNTLISTPHGNRRISDIQPGDVVYNMTGSASVRNVLHNKVKTSNLTLVYVNGSSILTTKDHLFFTSCGWVKASELMRGDVLYDNATLRNLRENISDVSKRQSQSMRKDLRRDTEKAESTDSLGIKAKKWLHKNVSSLWEQLLHTSIGELHHVFERLRLHIQEATRNLPESDKLLCYAQAGVYLSCLREVYEHPEERSSEILFTRMFGEGKVYPAETLRYPTEYEVLCDMWKYVYPEIRSNADLLQIVQVHADCFQDKRETESRIFSTNEVEQPYDQSKYDSEDDRNTEKERNMANALCTAWRKWAFYQSSDSAASSLRRWMGLRVSCENSCVTKQHDEVSYELQARPCISGKVPGCRGGWENPQYEISAVVRSEESTLFGKLRVDGVEILQRGYNERHFERYFSHSELSAETVDMYDLEISGHPSYYAEGVLVHNCHAFSQAAWQIFLKVLEDVPANTINVFCTTNPEKIPATILSRVQTFQLSKISLSGITNRLKYVLDSEISEGRDIRYDMDAVSYIAKLANGGMRDALTLLDKALTYSDDISLENISKSLNIPNYDDYFDLLNACAKKDNVNITRIVNNVYNSGVNFVSWFTGFHSFIVNIMKYIFLQDIKETMIPSYYEDKISKYNIKHSAVCLKLASKVLKMNNELKTAVYLQEVALTYLCS